MKETEHVMYDCTRYSEERKEFILYIYIKMVRSRI